MRLTLILALILTVNSSFNYLVKNLDEDFKYIAAKATWKTEILNPYLSSLDLVKEDVTDYTVNEDGSVTATTKLQDNTTVTYSNIHEKKRSMTGKNYVNYVYVTGLESIGIPDGKELVTIYLIPEEELSTEFRLNHEVSHSSY